MPAKTPEAAARSLSAIADALADGQAIADAYGAQLASDARSAGQRASSPRQAHLVAPAIRYQAGSIVAPASWPAGRGSVGELLHGAVFGSDRYRQFGPHRSGGYWLFPQLANPSPAAVDAGDRSIDQLIRGEL